MRKIAAVVLTLGVLAGCGAGGSESASDTTTSTMKPTTTRATTTTEATTTTGAISPGANTDEMIERLHGLSDDTDELVERCTDSCTAGAVSANLIAFDAETALGALGEPKTNLELRTEVILKYIIDGGEELKACTGTGEVCDVAKIIAGGNQAGEIVAEWEAVP